MDEASLAAVTEAAGAGSAALAASAARARSDPGSCAVVLVEGMSDQAAVETLAERSRRDLRGEGVFVVPMGGATNIGHFVDLFGPGGFGAPFEPPDVVGEDLTEVAAKLLALGS